MAGSLVLRKAIPPQAILHIGGKWRGDPDNFSGEWTDKLQPGGVQHLPGDRAFLRGKRPSTPVLLIAQDGMADRVKMLPDLVGPPGLNCNRKVTGGL